MKSRHIGYALLALLATEAILSPHAHSQALMVEPKRFVFDETHRGAIANLYNNSDDTLTYTVGWSHLRMNENGRYEQVDSIVPGEHIADGLIRFFPPEITLPPHSAQLLRLHYLKPRDLAYGEYNSHLLFSQVERAKPIERMREDTSDHQVRINLRPLWGISVPIIVRNDTSPASVSLDSVSISTMDTGRMVMLGVNILRSGVESSYGKLIVNYYDATGRQTQIDYFKNVAVYPPLRIRRVRMPLKIPADIDLSTGKIVVEYRTDSGDKTDRVQATAESAFSH